MPDTANPETPETDAAMQVDTETAASAGRLHLAAFLAEVARLIRKDEAAKARRRAKDAARTPT